MEAVREGKDKRLAKSFFRSKGLKNAKPDFANGNRFLALTSSRELDTRVWLKFYRAECAGMHASQFQSSPASYFHTFTHLFPLLS